jgi:GT2 family glycosyltransferase
LEAENSTPATIVVIVLTFNQREKTVKCLSSLLPQDDLAYRALVWDNGSQDATEPTVQEAFPQVLVHRHPTNLGVAEGRNEAAALAIGELGASHLLFLDNDILVEPGFVRALYEPFTEDVRLGQTQAKLRFMHDRERINDGGGARINYVLWRVRPVGFGEIDIGQYDRPRECISCGGAMMVRSDVFAKLGGFDVLFGPFGPEDLDFSLRLKKAGYRAMYIPQAVGYHQVSHTFGEGYTEDYARHKSRHWLLFMRRHATFRQRIAFYLFGAPYLSVTVLIRETRRGNLKGVRGLLRGVMEGERSPGHRSRNP